MGIFGWKNRLVILTSSLFAVFLSLPASADRPAALSPQTITRPSGPSSLKGLGESFSPNIATGTGNFSVPLQLPPGILAPEMSIQYSAGKGKGPLGTSFNLPVLNIYRTTDKGLPKFTEDDRFSVEGPTLNDELVLVNAEKRWYRLRNEGAFARFERQAYEDAWVIRLPNGHTLYLGQADEARQTSEGRTTRWFVTKHSDRFGHEIRYSYFNDGGRVYLEAITYQLHAAPHFWNTVELEYEQRPDRFVDYTYGAAMRTNLRLTGIVMSQGSRVLRHYELTYEEGLLSSLLSTVTMFGENDEPMPALSFEYVQPSRNTSYLVDMRQLPPLEGLTGGWSTLEDMNGDGLPDLLTGVSGNYRYYENLDGERFSDRPKYLANSPDRNLYDEGVLLADIDGDGYRDVVASHDGAFKYFPRGKVEDGVLRGYEPAQKLNIGWQPEFHFGSVNVKLTDLDHDGRVDLLYQKPGQDERILNRQNDTLQSEYVPELPVDVDFTRPEVQLTDFNGDGNLDFVRTRFWPGYTDQVRVWYGLGGGRYASEQSMTGVPSGLPEEMFLQDVNNDGQADLVRISGSWLTYYLNTGKGGFTGGQVSRYGLPPMAQTRKVLFADMNGNGTADVVWLTLDWKLTYLDLFSEPNFGLLKRVDNGMGMMTEIDYRSSTSYAIEAKLAGNPWHTPLPNPVPVISEIRVSDSFDALGLEANVSRTTFDYRDGYFDTKEREFRGFAEATSTSHGDEYHESLVTQTFMHVGRNLATGEDEEMLKGKPWLQLTKDIEGRLYGSVETRWQQRWMCQEDIQTTVSQKVLPWCKDFDDLDKHKEELVAFAVQTEALTGVWEKTNTPKFTATKAEHNAWGAVVRSETYGEVGIPGGHEPGASFDLSKMNLGLGQDEQVSETDYLYDVDQWMLGLSYSSRVTDLQGNLVGQMRTYFDGPAFVGLPLRQVGNGLVTRTSAWLKDGSGERWLDAKRMEYNADGLVVATKDANDNLAELDYDYDVGMFPITERFHVDVGPLEFRAQYDLGTGAITSATDLNGNSTYFYYDGLGRLTDVVDPDSTPSVPTAIYSYDPGTPDYPLSITTSQTLVDRTSGRYSTSISYSDGQGRTRLVKTQAEKYLIGGWIGSGWARLSPRGSATHVYDSFTSQNSGFEPAPTFSPVTESLFDGQGRAIQVTPPATEYGLTSTVSQYLPFETRVYDERDTKEGTWLYPASTLVDGLGRVRQIVKHNNIEEAFRKLTWNVEYDTAGNITGFVDPKGHKRDYSYDSLGRMLSVTDPNAGHVDYTYDKVGNLIQRVDSLGQTQSWEYGAANRLMRAVMTGDPHGRPAYEYEYTYDVPSPQLSGATNLLGKLSQASYPTGTIQFSYDKLDRLTQEVQTLWDGTSPSASQKRDRFSQAFTYNAAGQVTSEQSPGNLRLDFLYNERNLVYQIQGGFNGGRSTLFNNVLYDQRGAVVQTDANSVVTTFAWYDNRARLKAVAAGPKADISWSESPLTADPDAIQHLVYNRTPTGLISNIQDLTVAKPGYPRFDASYKYDRLYQLIEANTPQGKFNYSYDEVQNFTKRTASDPQATILTGVFGYGERGAGPNQITTAGNQTFEYDSVGQMKQYKGFNLTFDVEGRLVKAKRDGGVSLEYHYDDTGARKLAIVKRAGQADKIHRFITGRYQIRNGEETWILGAGLSQAEIRQSEGLRVDLPLLDELTQYVQNPIGKKKPLIEEYMDLDGDGDGFDADDLAVAYEAYWNEEPAGGPKKVWKYYLKDHLGGTTHTVDSRGEVVSHQQYHPYGKTAHRDGARPTYGFAGSEVEEEEELGLMQFGARWYAPEVGRWVSADPLFLSSATTSASRPLESGLYSYATNSPISGKDPSGLGTVVTQSQVEGGAEAAKLLVNYVSGKIDDVKKAWSAGSGKDKVEIAATGVGAVGGLFPYAGDYVSLGASVTVLAAKPSWEAAGDVGLDAIGAVLPICPALGTIKRLERIGDAADGVKDIGKVADAAKAGEKGTKASSSRAARREAMRQNNTPTSRPATSQSSANGRRQTVVEGSDGKPRVQTQHPPDSQHPDPHWHDSKPKLDDDGMPRTNQHGQIKDQNQGRSTVAY